MLLVWLFGLAMGMANACALGDRVHHGVDPASIAASDDGQKHHHGDERGDSSKVNCLDFCEKSSIRAPQLKLVGDGSAELGFPLPVQDALLAPGQCEHRVSRLVVDSPHLPGGPPPRIAFQRLAL